jgi:CHAT domain-containing protein
MKRFLWLIPICLVCVVAVPGLKSWPSHLRSSQQRSIQPRLTFEPDYAHCEPQPGANVWCSSPQRTGAEARRSPSPEAGRSEGGVSRGASRAEALSADVARQIASQSPGAVEGAVRQLESKARRNPNDAKTLNDLAAAYFVRGQQRENLSDLVQALSTVDRAVRAKDDLPEALFNRALFLQEMSLRTEAYFAWQGYLRLPEESGWDAEAQARLQSLKAVSADEIWAQQRNFLDEAALQGDAGTVEGIVSRFRQQARKYVEEKVLGRWGEALEANDGERASRFLKIARSIGDALREAGGDEMAADAVAVIDQASAKTDSARLRTLAEGHRAYSQGMGFLDALNIAKARPQFENADKVLRAARSPFAAWARLQTASCDYYHNQYEETRQSLEEIDQSLLDDRYSSLRGRIQFILGSMDVRQGRPGDALRRFERGRQLFAKANETENLATMEHQFAIALGVLGSKDLWHHLFRALRVLDEIPSHRRVFGILDEAGAAAMREGHPDIALYFQNELLENARRWNDPEQISAALLRRADTFGASRRTDEALESLDRAFKESDRIIDPTLRANIKASLLLSSGQIHLSTSPELAIRELTSAIDAFRSTEQRVSLSLALFLRARTYLTVQDSTRAMEDFSAGLEEIESTRESLTNETLRITFADQATQSFDEILSFEAGQSGWEETSFNLAERARARELLEDVAVSSLTGGDARSGGSQPLTVAELRAALPAQTLVVKYAVLPDKTLLWSLTRNELKLRTLPVGMKVLQQQVNQAVAAMQAGKAPQEQLRKILGDLYTQLLSPVESELAQARDLIVIPDKDLHRLPFAALLDPRTDDYLIQDHGVAMAPSVNVYVRCLLRRVNQENAPLANALLVGDPSFDSQEFPSLQRLPDAAAEARATAEMYPRNFLLVGEDATKANVLRQIARGPELIQISAHALESPEHPEYTRVLFARDPQKNDSGVLYLHEIRTLHFTNTRLVVLAGCGTAAGPVSASEGSLSLARAFLASGVPAVIATRWNIDDATSRKLMTEFHRRLQSGEDAVTALRWSQVAQIIDKEGTASHPWNWASFQLIGGSNPTGGERQ